MTADWSVVLTVVFLACVNGISTIESRAENHRAENLSPLVAAYTRVRRQAKTDSDQAVTSPAGTRPPKLVTTDTVSSEPSGEEIDIDDPRDTTVHDLQQLLGTNTLKSRKRKRSLRRHHPLRQQWLLKHHYVTRKTRLQHLRRPTAPQVTLNGEAVEKNQTKIPGDVDKNMSSVFDDDSFKSIILRQRRQQMERNDTDIDTTDLNISDLLSSDYDIQSTNNKWPSSRSQNQRFIKEEGTRQDIAPSGHSAGLRLSDDEIDNQSRRGTTPTVFPVTRDMFADLHWQDIPSSYKQNRNAASDTNISTDVDLSDDEIDNQSRRGTTPTVFPVTRDMFADLHWQDIPSSYEQSRNAASDTNISTDVDLFLAESSDGSLDLDASSSDSSGLGVTSNELSLNNKKTTKRRMQQKASNNLDDETNEPSTELSYSVPTNSYFLSTSSSESLETSTTDSRINSIFEERGGESEANTMINIASVSSSVSSLPYDTADVTSKQTRAQEGDTNPSYPAKDTGSSHLPQENNRPSSYQFLNNYTVKSQSYDVDGRDIGQPVNSPKTLKKFDVNLRNINKGEEPSYVIETTTSPQTSGTELATEAAGLKESTKIIELIRQTLNSQTSSQKLTAPLFISNPSANSQSGLSSESVPEYAPLVSSDFPHNGNSRMSRSLAYEEVIEEPNSGYTQWEQWSACSKRCGVGNAERRRTCVHRSRCKSGDIEIKLCINEDRPKC